MIYLAIFSLVFGYVYEDSDSLIVQNDSLVICGDHQYDIKVHISNAGKLKVRQWNAADSTGWLLLNAPLILIQDSSSINGSKTGYMGGNNSHPDGYGPGYGEAGSMNGGAGGGAGYGGDGGNGGGLYPGAGGSVYGDPSDTLIDIGSGGGAGRYLYVVDGFGGNGGAMTYLKAQQIIVDSSYIETNGEDGYVGTSLGFEAGGGGSGGGIMLWADSVIIHHSAVNSNGGNGANSELGGGGGAGGGRIKIFYTNSLDTTHLSMSAQGGNPGTGSEGDPEPGSPGSIYIAQIVGIEEIANGLESRFFLQSHIIRYQTIVHVAEPPVVLHLYDAAGCLVKSFRLEKTTACLKLADLAQGVYFLKVGLKDNRVEKIILLK